MYIYRPHRGSLAESMNNAREFETKKEMLEYIVSQHSLAGSKPFTIHDIVIDRRSFSDGRIGWIDGRNVCIKRYGNQVFDTPQCIGMCATKYIRKEVAYGLDQSNFIKAAQ